MQIAESERLILRRFMPDDAEALFAYLSDPQPACFYDEKLEDMAAAREEATKRRDDDTQYAICLKETDAVIGHLFASGEAEPDDNTLSVGWYVNPHYQGQGFALEATTCLFTYLFNVRDVRRLYAYVASDNAGSQALCRRLGMRLEGCFKEYVCFTQEDGVPVYEDTLVFALLQKEW